MLAGCDGVIGHSSRSLYWIEAEYITSEVKEGKEQRNNIMDRAKKKAKTFPLGFSGKERRNVFAGVDQFRNPL